MTDFDKRFRKHQDEFDRDWERARKWAWISSVLIGLFILSITGFIVWVIIMVMRHFGII